MEELALDRYGNSHRFLCVRVCVCRQFAMRMRRGLLPATAWHLFLPAPLWNSHCKSHACVRASVCVCLYLCVCLCWRFIGWTADLGYQRCQLEPPGPPLAHGEDILPTVLVQLQMALRHKHAQSNIQYTHTLTHTHPDALSLQLWPTVQGSLEVAAEVLPECHYGSVSRNTFKSTMALSFSTYVCVIWVKNFNETLI